MIELYFILSTTSTVAKLLVSNVIFTCEYNKILELTFIPRLIYFLVFYNIKKIQEI